MKSASDKFADTLLRWYEFFALIFVTAFLFGLSWGLLHLLRLVSIEIPGVPLLDYSALEVTIGAGVLAIMNWGFLITRSLDEVRHSVTELRQAVLPASPPSDPDKPQ